MFRYFLDYIAIITRNSKSPPERIVLPPETVSPNRIVDAPVLRPSLPPQSLVVSVKILILIIIIKQIFAVANFPSFHDVVRKEHAR